MTLREQVDAAAAKRLAEIKQTIHGDSQNLPAWEQVVRVAQQGSKDIDLMERLSCC